MPFSRTAASPGKFRIVMDVLIPTLTSFFADPPLIRTQEETMSNAKPAEGNGGHRDREIVISGWKPHSKNTLAGFFTATLASGLVLHDLMLHEKGESRWIAFPAREWTNEQGVKQYARFIEFRDRVTADKFRDAVLAALDRHLEAPLERSGGN
jgi:hypothetical protein